MWDTLDRLFGQGFMPHGHCYLWTPSMVWTQVSSNLLIGLSYVSIAATLASLVRRIRRSLPFLWAFVAFGIFILSCGLTHFLDIVTVWHPVYWADAGVRVVTAIASAATAMWIVPLVPRAEALAHASRLAEERGRELEKAHVELATAHAELAKRAEAKDIEFRELIDNLPDLAWTAMPDGHVDFYNRRWFEFTGTTFEQMEGWGWKTVHDPAVLSQVVERWTESLKRGESFEMEFPLRGANGLFRWFLTRVRPLRDKGGRILRWFGSNTDIDERRRVRDQLEATLERERLWRREAEEATRLKDEFLAAVSHELRTPLNAILGWSRLLSNGQLQPEPAKRAVATIERNALAQVQLVDDLLDISRIVTGKLRLELQVVSLTEVIENATDTLRPAIEAKGLRVEVAVASPVHDVVGDAARLQQVVWNLLGNAVKFSDKHGRIAVTVSAASSRVDITVRDWGKGMKQEFVPYVFDRFRQADGSTTRAYGGLGLGLAIAKYIVELHGGTITAGSEGEGKGATFVVSLARGGAVSTTHGDSAIPVSDRVPDETGDALELRGARILVVDDEADGRDLVRVTLEGAGSSVLTAASAKDALAVVEAFGPDVVLTDLGMPDEDGFALLAKLQAIPAMQKIPAAALTAFARAEDRRRVLAAGFQMHLAKPIAPAELLAAVANLVRIRRALS